MSASARFIQELDINVFLFLEDSSCLINTLPETNIFAPENGWLEDDRFLLGQKAYFQVQNCC